MSVLSQEFGVVMERGRSISAKAETKEISYMVEKYKVSARALRFYESKSLLKPIRKDGQRLYGAEDESRLQFIIQGKRLGFTLLEIKTMMQKHKTLTVHKASASVYPSSGQLEIGFNSDQLYHQIVFLKRRREEIDRMIRELEAVFAQIANV